jgi:hypothetical protein
MVPIFDISAAKVPMSICDGFPRRGALDDRVPDAPGVDPGTEEGTQRQVHGGVLSSPTLRPTRACPRATLCVWSSRPSSAVVLVFPQTLSICWPRSACGSSRLGVRFIEVFVTIGPGRRHASAAPIRTLVVTTGGNGPMEIWYAAAQVARAGDPHLEAVRVPPPHSGVAPMSAARG